MALESDAILWDLLNETPGEIYDVDEIEEEKFDVEQYINGNTDYWYKPSGCPTTCMIGTTNLKVLFRSSVS